MILSGMLVDCNGMFMLTPAMVIIDDLTVPAWYAS